MAIKGFLMRRCLPVLAAVAALVVVGTGTAHAAVLLDDDFASYTVGTSYAEGATFGNWTDVFNGFGYQKIVQDGVNHQLEQAPQAATQPSETHAALTTSTSSYTPKHIIAEGSTLSQLRTGSAPNPWEVGWLAWNYVDNDHMYYLSLKPNGWELGKRDPAYTGGQRFLATGTSLTYPIGSWLRYDITQTVNGDGSVTMVVKAKKNNNTIQTLTTFTDSERPITSGKIGLYNEDAKTWWGWVQVSG